MNEQPQANRDWIEVFYRGLQELVNSSFPKTCPKCGRVFPTTAAFLADTTPVRNIKQEDRSGLFCIDDSRVGTAVGLFRNCTCGTTIMADFRDRRDNSPDGRLRRQRFDALMELLTGKGLSIPDARRELRKVLQGKPSTLIENLIDTILTA